MKERLDIILVSRGLTESRERAKALIMEGNVLVDGVPLTKAGCMVDQEARIELRSGEMPYVSRGGLKLEAALEHFSVNLDGVTAMDVGSSTGGFTDCMPRNVPRNGDGSNYCPCHHSSAFLPAL